MNLPDFFLADLPPEATLTPTLLAEACLELKRNRERYLAGRPTESVIRLLAGVAADWLRSDSPFRLRALAEGPAALGFSAPTLARGLDAFFGQLTEGNLWDLVEMDLGHARRLDVLSSVACERATQRAALARGPELLLHVTAGNLPLPALLSMTLGLLTRSAQFVKCASGATLLPRLFAHSLHEADPKVGACLEVAAWPGGTARLEEVVFEEADCVTATGSDATLAAVRARLPQGTRFLGYGQRVSFGFVTGEALDGGGARRTAAAAAADVAAWDQLGCLSPHAFYIESGGGIAPEEFAALLAEELAALEPAQPRGAVPVEVAATIASRRAFYEVRAAHSEETRLWASPASTAWTVVYEAQPLFQASCLHRFVYVKRVASLAEMLQAADAVRDKVSTVGIAASGARLPELVATLARWGVARVCPLGRMQEPPLAWRHDGRPSLGDLVTWTDWERGGGGD